MKTKNDIIRRKKGESYVEKQRSFSGRFFKIGAFTFGGGYAMVALLQNEFVEEKKWVTKEEFLDMVQLRSLRPARWR